MKKIYGRTQRWNVGHLGWKLILCLLRSLLPRKNIYIQTTSLQMFYVHFSGGVDVRNGHHVKDTRRFFGKWKIPFPIEARKYPRRDRCVSCFQIFDQPVKITYTIFRHPRSTFCPVVGSLKLRYLPKTLISNYRTAKSTLLTEDKGPKRGKTSASTVVDVPNC